MPRTLTVLYLLVGLAGCTVGPDYRRPPVPVSEQWLEPGSLGAVDTRWWDRFDDPVLSDLVRRAIAANPDLKEAQARIREARANRDATAGGSMPEVNAKGSATYNRISENGQLPVSSIPGFDLEYPLYDIGFDASWELDLWGRNRREIEGANARTDAALWSQRDVLITLISEMVRSYVDFRVGQREIALAEAEVETNASLAHLAGLRFRAGEGNRIELGQAESQRAASQGALERARANAVAAAYRVATLAGVAPETIVPTIQASSASIPAPPVDIARGVRSDLLLRRPDVRRAERELAAATADIGVATADLFPRFSLLGSLGQQARSPGDLLSSASTRFSIGPSFSWPIFSAGRIRAQIRATNARADAAAARYEKAVVSALSESESAANRFARGAAVADAAARDLGEEQRGYELARLRYRKGEDDKLALERARLRLVLAERRLTTAVSEQDAAAVALYKALGGGWE